MAEIKDPKIDIELSREMSLFHITMMGVGMMIGAGVFVGTGISIGISGPGGILLTFALNGLIALFTAMSYAELSSAIPRAGGAYNYVQQGFGGFPGFLAGWMEWFASSAAGSLYAITFATYILHFLSGFEALSRFNLESDLLMKLVALLAALVFIYINYRGASETGTAGSLMAIGQTVTLALVAVVGVIVVLRNPGRLSNFTPFLPHGWGKIFITMGFTYVAFEGFEVISQTGDEAIDPRKNIPKAIFYSILIVVTTYLAVSFATVVGIRAEGVPVWQWMQERGATGFAEAVAQLMPMGGILVIAAVIFSSTSALNATTYSATRVSFALGRDRLLPPAVSRISSRTKVPHIALLLSAILIVGMAVTLPIEDVVSGASIMFLLLFFLVNMSAIKVRRERGDELTYGYVMPFFPYIPLIAIVLQVALAVWLVHKSWIAWVVAGTWILLGFVLYMLYSRSRGTEVKEKISVLREIRELVTKEYQIMLPVANPENAARLVDYAGRIARAKDGEILVLNMVVVPGQMPLSEATAFVDSGEDAIIAAMTNAPEGVPVHSTVRLGRDAARGILSGISEHASNLVVLGWGGSVDKGFALGRTIDPVIEKAPCDSMVIKLNANEVGVKPKRILVPLTYVPHGYLALDMAGILADEPDSEITIMHVIRKEVERENAQRNMEVMLRLLGEKEDRGHVKILGPGEVGDLIVQESENHDLIIIGATRESGLQQMVFGSLPEQIAKRSNKTVIMVKAYTGIQSRLRRWFGG
ncbi:amino acid permease [Candidatus Poribacteria bacterium]